jgi:hypothetical protein
LDFGAGFLVTNALERLQDEKKNKIRLKTKMEEIDFRETRAELNELDIRIELKVKNLIKKNASYRYRRKFSGKCCRMGGNDELIN